MESMNGDHIQLNDYKREPSASLTEYATLIVTDSRFEIVVGMTVIANCIVTCFMITPEAQINHGYLLSAIDSIILGLFCVEATIRALSQTTQYLKDYWNMFDLAMIIYQFMLLGFEEFLHEAGLSHYLYSLFVLRIFKGSSTNAAFRAIWIVKTVTKRSISLLKTIIKTFLTSLSALASTAFISGLLICLLL
jgi:hypothetical protein